MHWVGRVKVILHKMLYNLLISRLLLDYSRKFHQISKKPPATKSSYPKSKLTAYNFTKI